MLEQKVYEFIAKNRLIENGDKIVLGVSGGPDSMCMLNILRGIASNKKINFDIVVAHINHGLRESAMIDEKFVKDFCLKLDIPFFVKHVNLKEISNNKKRGLEETGRIVRYEFFEEILQETKSNKIAIAHNKNDKIETIIMNVLRGSGTAGLIGIKEKSCKFIRPLINIKRDEIEEYLREENIIAMHDESNDENIYTRNKIRNIVIPYIKREFNPNILQSIDRLSEIIKEQEEYITNIAKKYYTEICIKENNVTENYKFNKENSAEIILDLKKFNNLDRIIQKKIIFLAINKIFGTTKGIEKIHIDDIIKLCNNYIGNKYLTPNKNIKVVTKKKQLTIMAIP